MELVKFYRDFNYRTFVNRLRKFTPFQFLVLSILSQNTNDKLAYKAFQNLLNEVKELTIDNILKIDRNKIIECIKISGMYVRKTETILDLAKFLSKFNSDEILARLPCNEIEKLLSNVRGLGYKTIDVFLLLYRNCPTFPIDTHIKRIFSRLGLFNSNSYPMIRNIVIYCFKSNVDKLIQLHLILIHHGRNVCKAVKPICEMCVIKKYCKYYNLRKSEKI